RRCVIPFDAEGGERTYGQWWSFTENHVAVKLDALRSICLMGYERAGASPEDAEFLLGPHLDKALQGDHVRGIGAAVTRIRAALRGELDVKPTVHIVRETGATAVVDGGPTAAAALICREAMELAITKARTAGVG